MSKKPFFLFGLILLSSCDRPAISPSQSLVGAKTIPSARELERETIQINRGFGEMSQGLLVYELTSDNQLKVSVENTKGNTRAVRVDGADLFKLSVATADRARLALWRLRPEKANGLAEELRPLGCTPQYDHDWGEAAVVFIVPDPKLNIRSIRSFVLPGPESCENKTANEARVIVRNVIASFPPSRVAYEFDRQTKGAWTLTTPVPAAPRSASR